MKFAVSLVALWGMVQKACISWDSSHSHSWGLRSNSNVLRETPKTQLLLFSPCHEAAWWLYGVVHLYVYEGRPIISIHLVQLLVPTWTGLLGQCVLPLATGDKQRPLPLLYGPVGRCPTQTPSSYPLHVWYTISTYSSLAPLIRCTLVSGYPSSCLAIVIVRYTVCTFTGLFFQLMSFGSSIRLHCLQSRQRSGLHWQFALSYFFPTITNYTGNDKACGNKLHSLIIILEGRIMHMYNDSTEIRGEKLENQSNFIYFIYFRHSPNCRWRGIHLHRLKSSAHHTALYLAWVPLLSTESSHQQVRDAHNEEIEYVSKWTVYVYGSMLTRQ